MAIIQDAYDIPDSIMTKLLTGEYKRYGGVIRHANGPHKGQIVKLLDPINSNPSESTQKIGTKALQFAKNNKKTLIIVGIGVGIVAAGAGVYQKLKRKEPEVVTKFRYALKDYINAIRNGKLDIETIDNLTISLVDLKKHKDYEKFNIQMSTEELDVLVGKIYEYTLKLARDNLVELSDEEQDKADISENPILSLQKYLCTQKRIFETAR